MNEELLTVDEVCAWFKIRKEHLHDLVEQRRLPAYKLGRLLRFDRQELKAYLADCYRPARGGRQ